MRIFGVILAVLLLTGCAHALGYAGKNPGAIECNGKAQISIQGAGAIAVGYGGTEVQSGSIIFDCQNGSIKQYNPQPDQTLPAK